MEKELKCISAINVKNRLRLRGKWGGRNSVRFVGHIFIAVSIAGFTMNMPIISAGNQEVNG